MTTEIEYKKIDATGYKGLAKAHIDRYNRTVKDLARENRLGRGDESYAQNLIANSQWQSHGNRQHGEGVKNGKLNTSGLNENNQTID